MSTITNPLPHQTPRPLAEEPRAALSRRHRHLLSAFADRFAGGGVPPFELELPDGTIHRCGGAPPRAHEPGAREPARFRLAARDERGVGALASFDEARAAEAFVEGSIDVEGDFLAALDLRRFFTDRHPFWSLWRFVPPLISGQVRSDKRWIPRHYDFGDDFYFTFLDKSVRLYSQALFRSAGETLEQAARNKLDYIFDACRLTAGSRVLDVGAGWGSFARYAAHRGAHVTMMTLAERQFAYLQHLAEDRSTAGRLDVVRENIYAFTSRQRYDAIVLLGVMEHLPDYDRLMRRFEGLTEPNARVYMDFSAIRTKYNISSFVYRHVFPGNHSPVVLPDLLAAVNRHAFEPIAVCNDRHSYYLTLQAWGRNLEAARGELVARVGRRTFRLFQLYLWATAHDLGCTGELESYRVVLQRSRGHASAQVGL